MEQENIVVICPECGSNKVNKDGNKRGKQAYKCKECNRKFVFGDYIGNFNYSTVHKENESKCSFNKITDKVTKVNIIKKTESDLNNTDYMKKYKSSIFEGDEYIERIFKRINQQLNKRDKYPILTEYGLEIFGKKLLEFGEEYKKIKCNKTMVEYEKWLDQFTQYIFDKILEVGESKFCDIFSDKGWCEEIMMRCRIYSCITENKGLKIIKYVLENNKKEISFIEKEVLLKMTECLNKETLENLDNLFNYNNMNADLRFYLKGGIIEKLYGDYWSFPKDYSYKRMDQGAHWEYTVGVILNEHYNNVYKHPRIANNKIPDYALVDFETKNFLKFIECKLVLNFKELEDTLKKYSTFINKIDIYCYENKITQDIIDSKEYKNLINSLHSEFNYDIIDFKKIYSMTKYKTTLKLFEENLRHFTKNNMIKEQITIAFDSDKAEILNKLIDKFDIFGEDK